MKKGVKQEVEIKEVVWGEPLRNKKYLIYNTEPKTDLEKWIKSITPKILDLYGIGRISVCFSGEVSKVHEEKSGSLTVFSVMYDSVYKSLSLTVFDVAQDAWEAGDKEFLLNSLIHEFAHVLTTPIATSALARHVTKKEIVNLAEELTESIAVIARELYELKGKN